MKRNLYIILGIIAFVLIVLGVYFMFFRGSKNSTNNPESSPVTSPSDTSLFGNGQNDSGNGELFSNATASPAAGQGTLTVAEQNTNTTTEIINSGNTVCAWMNNISGQGIDSDSDDLPDSIEKIYNTNSANPDTDGDSFKDGNEVKNGYNPLVVGSARLDSNNNGIFDNQECKQNTNPLVVGQNGNSVAITATTGTNAGTQRLSNLLTGNTTNVVTPISTTKPTTTTAQQTTTSTTLNTTLPIVDASSFHISKTNTPSEIENYLALVKSKSPKDLTNNVNFVNALVQAFAGKPEEIQKIRNNISNYNKTLTTMLIPSTALEYHKQLIAINIFLYDRLGVIQDNAKTNPQAAMKAAQELQTGLPTAISSLSLMQEKLVGRAAL